jgi:hypothetical protein
MKIAFTIATANYLAQAKALGDSFMKYNSGYKFFILLLDRVEGRFDTSYFYPAEVLELEEVKVEGFDEMVEQYNIFELSNALKPFIAEYLLLTYRNTETVLFFDSDILIYGPVAEVHSQLKSFSIVLTPHLTSPLPLDDIFIDEKGILNAGIYNGGFFALRRSEVAFSFLSWWKDRLKKHCIIDFRKGLFVDQIWLNLVPIYFDDVLVLKNLGYNVAYWNLHERFVSKKWGKYAINDQVDLVFYHFSGFDFSKTDVLSKYQNRFSLQERKDVSVLFEEYTNIVLKNKFDFFSTIECFFVKEKKRIQHSTEKCMALDKPLLKKFLGYIKRKLSF